jgi:hypothetical protein
MSRRIRCSARRTNRWSFGTERFRKLERWCFRSMTDRSWSSGRTGMSSARRWSHRRWPAHRWPARRWHAPRWPARRRHARRWPARRWHARRWPARTCRRNRARFRIERDLVERRKKRSRTRHVRVALFHLIHAARWGRRHAARLRFQAPAAIEAKRQVVGIFTPADVADHRSARGPRRSDQVKYCAQDPVSCRTSRPNARSITPTALLFSPDLTAQLELKLCAPKLRHPSFSNRPRRVGPTSHEHRAVDRSKPNERRA